MSAVYRTTFVGGMKGGVGKSFTTNCIVYLYDLYNKLYELVDADTNNPDVAKLHGIGETTIKFAVEDEVTGYMSQEMSETDRLFELAQESDVIVNLPSDVENKLIYWFDSSQVLSTEVNEGKVKFAYWFVSNGSHQNINLFLSLLKRLEGRDIEWVFVKNKRLCMDWKRIEGRSDFIEAKKEYGFKEVELPGLPDLERDYLEKQKLTFAQAIKKDSGMLTINRQRVKNCLKLVKKNFIEAGILPSLELPKTEENSDGLNGVSTQVELSNDSQFNSPKQTEVKEEIEPNEILDNGGGLTGVQ